MLSIAGLWDRWHSPGTYETVLSCTMIVTDANAFTRAVHNRMPVLLDRPHIEAWAERLSRSDRPPRIAFAWGRNRAG